jgi:hypothetical protein
VNVIARWVCGAAAVCLLAGCATDAAYEARLADLDAHGVTGLVREKVADEAALSGREIATLSRQGVSDTTIVGHVRASGATYTLTTAGVTQLRKAGVSDAVIDYLLATPAIAAQRQAARAEWLAWNVSYGYPYRYYGVAPYGYGYRYGYGYPHGYGHRHCRR